MTLTLATADSVDMFRAANAMWALAVDRRDAPTAMRVVRDCIESSLLTAKRVLCDRSMTGDSSVLPLRADHATHH